MLEDEITYQGSELVERFVQGDTSRNTKRLGLGLIMVKSFSEIHGGKLYEEIVDDILKYI